eukprot:607556-Amphidinium_carterae.2
MSSLLEDQRSLTSDPLLPSWDGKITLAQEQHSHKAGSLRTTELLLMYMFGLSTTERRGIGELICVAGDVRYGQN